MSLSISEILLRLRHWLIKKLGGFAEQKVVIYHTDARTIRAIPVRITAACRVDAFNLQGWVPPDMVRYIKKELSHELASELTKYAPSDLIRMDCSDDPCTHSMEYRATVYILSAHDAALFGL